MRQLVFALQFKGDAAPVEGAEGKLWAKTTATSQTLRTTIGTKGVESAIEGAGSGSVASRADRAGSRERVVARPGLASGGSSGCSGLGGWLGPPGDLTIAPSRLLRWAR
jgi:hypothetical protein